MNGNIYFYWNYGGIPFLKEATEKITKISHFLVRQTRVLSTFLIRFRFKVWKSNISFLAFSVTSFKSFNYFSSNIIQVAKIWGLENYSLRQMSSESETETVRISVFSLRCCLSLRSSHFPIQIPTLTQANWREKGGGVPNDRPID